MLDTSAMESSAGLVVALLTLAGCGAFGEEPAPPNEVAVAPAAQHDEPPPASEPATAPAPAPVTLPPPPPGAGAWAGTRMTTTREEYGGGTVCTYAITFKDIGVGITIDGDGAPLAARVTATAVETASTLCPYPFDHTTPHVYTMKVKGWSSLPDNGKRIELEAAETNKTQASLVLEGRFEDERSPVALHWERTDPLALYDWRVDTVVDLIRTAPR